jgi:hypothetical protein
MQINLDFEGKCDNYFLHVGNGGAHFHSSMS